MTSSLPVDASVFAVAALLTVCVVIVGTSQRLRVPASLLSLALGMVIGSDGLGWIDLSDAGLVRDLGAVALVIILFEGGLTTKPSAIRHGGWAGPSLATIGVVITACITAAGASLLLDISWPTALLLGAVVASTDAAVVFELLRRAPLPRRVASVLEVESGTNDPVAVLLTIGLVEVIAGGAPSVSEWVVFGISQLFGGIIVGYAVGWAGTLLLRLPLRSQGLYPLLATGVAGLTYAAATSIGASGFLAVYVCGLIVGAKVPRRRRIIRSFHESLASGVDMALFLLLGLLVFPTQLPGVALPAIGVSVVLILIARPVAVAVSLAFTSIDRREKAVLSWAGLKGAVPIVLATYPATAGLEAGGLIFNIVFFVVLISLVVQGSTVVPLANRLGIVSDHPAWQSIAETLPIDGGHVDVVEVHAVEGLPLIGARLGDIPPGRGIHVLVVIRGDDTVLATGTTTFVAGDLILLAIDRRLVDGATVTAWARGELGTPGTADGQSMSSS